MSRFYDAFHSEANSYSVIDSQQKNEFGEQYCVEPYLCKECAKRVVKFLNGLTPEEIESELQNPTYGAVC